MSAASTPQTLQNTVAEVVQDLASVPEPTAHIAQASFSDGSVLDFADDDIVVFVGPNNAGKSQALRDLRDLMERNDRASTVIKSVTLRQSGTDADVITLIKSRGRRNENNGNFLYTVNGRQVNSGHAFFWNEASSNALQNLAPLFVHHIDVQSRLTAANTAPSFPRATGQPTEPAHHVYVDPRKEEAIAKAFKQAFGQGIVFNRSGGSEIPILFGDRPTKAPGEEEYTESFQAKLAPLPLVSTQGDGMRCFAGILLNVIASPTTVLLIDEPEAFLHPPQARVLGKFLATNRQKGQQLFVSTHSSDLLRGMLDANTGRVRVVRLIRDRSVNHVRQLKNADITNFWKDPLLRFSNILDGLFHDTVVVTEADGDCRFYSAVADANADTMKSRQPDILYVPTFGKDRLLVIIKALRAIGVPTVAIADFDFLDSAKRVEDLYLASGGSAASWATLAPLHRQVEQAVMSDQRTLDATILKPFIEKILQRTTGSTIDPDDARQIRARLKLESPWQNAKRTGIVSLPGGQVYNACDQLLIALEKVGLLVVRKGQLESFDPSVGKHGPAWVNDAMMKDLKSDPQLADARAFVKRVIEWNPSGGADS